MSAVQSLWRGFKSLSRWLLVTLCVLLCLVALALGFAALRVLLYDQQDDAKAMEGKRTYLHDLRERAVSSPPGAPNIVFILYDDLGYGDLSMTGSRAIATPNIDALAEQGMTLDRFYSPAPVCTPSRFGFLTGRFAERGLPQVVFPADHPLTWLQKFNGQNTRIPAHEVTLAEILQAAGYRTGMVGKWHLGDHSPSLPNDLGFEEFFGALYSNDMTPFALYRNREVVQAAPADQTRISEAYADEAVSFIGRHRDQPFFLYLAHSFPHIPLHVRESRRGQSSGGLYGDVVEELDEGLGEIMAALEAAGVADQTLVILTSDNGPWFQGSPGGVRGRKSDTFEGGMHVPFVARWPGALCRGCRSDGLAMGTDLLPTVLDLLQLPAPPDRILDGRSLLPMLTRGTGSPHQYLYYFSRGLRAVRDNRFKYMPRRGIVHTQAGSFLGIAMPRGPWLFDLESDPDESYDASERWPGERRRLRQAHDRRVQAMRENPSGWQR